MLDQIKAGLKYKYVSLRALYLIGETIEGLL